MDEKLGTELVSKNALSLLNDNECIQFHAPELFLLFTIFIPFETFTYCKVYRHTDTSGGFKAPARDRRPT